MENIWKKIDETITLKEIDKKRKPYAVQNTLSLCLKNSIVSVFKPDPRFDDSLLYVEESCAEPMCSVIDNCKGDAKVNKVVKEIPELPSAAPSIEVLSRASSPAASTRMKRSVTIRKPTDSEAASVNGDKKGVKRGNTIGPGKGQPADQTLDIMFQPRPLIPEYFNYDDALTDNQISNMRERATQRAI